MNSVHLNDERSLRLCVPGEAQKNQPHQVIYVLDEAGLFDLVVATMQYLSNPEVDLMPPAIVVGIQGKYDFLRNELGFNSRNGTLTAAGENFRNFLIQEIPAYLKKQYPNAADFKVLVGQGLSALYTLDLNEKYPGAFDALIALAPENPNYALDLAEPFYSLNRPQFLYLAAPGKDLSARKQFAYQTGNYLEKHPVDFLRLHYDSIPEANLQTLPPLALPKAFEFIYQNYMGGPGLQSWYARAAINPDNYYTEPRQQNQTYYQIPLRPTAALATVLLSKALELDDVQGAQAIIRDFQSRAPQDPALHALLAEFLHFDLHEPKAAERLYLLALEEYQRSTAPYRAIPTYFKLMDLYIGQQNGKAAWDLGQTARTLLKVSTFDYQLGKIADAFDIHLSEAIELNKQLLASGDAVHTDEVAIQFLLAGLYAKQGQPEQAKELLEKILQVQENHAGALKLLKQL